MKPFEKAFISSRAGIPVADFLADELPLSKGRIKEAMQKGAVWLKRGDEEPQRVRRAKDTVKLRDEIHIYYDPEFLDIELPPLRCVTQQEQFSIWIKPEGILDTVNLFGDHLSLERLIERDMPRELDCFLVDPAAGEICGLMLAAHTRAFAASMESLIEAQALEKDYRITVKGTVDGTETLTHAGKEYPITLLKYNDYNKTSQVRLNAAQAIEGDIPDLLSAFGLDPLQDEQLQCCAIRFVHPVTGKPASFQL